MNAYRMKECTMSNKERAKALAYIKKCEEGKKGKEFKDFEKKVVSYIEVRATGAYPVVWNYLFVEYVLLEVVSKNQMNALPKYPHNYFRRFLSYLHRFTFRVECDFDWEAHPRYHGKIYRDVINRALARENMLTNFPLKCPLKYNASLATLAAHDSKKKK